MMHGFSLIKAEPGGRFARLLINTKYMLLDSRIVIVNGVQRPKTRGGLYN